MQNWRRAKQNALLGILLVLFLPIGLLAQSPFFAPPASNDLLIDITVKHLYESQFGFIWMGSDQGLYRFDGVEYKAYDLPVDSTGISTEVSSIYQTKDNRIWAAFNDGQIYHPSYDGNLVPWERNNDLGIYSPITSFWEYEDQLWISTYGQGLFVVTPDTSYNFTTDDGILGNDIYQMVQDDQGHAYLATDLGINICFFKNGKFLASATTHQDGLPGYIIRTFVQDGEGGFYVGTFDNGVFYWHPEKGDIVPVIDNWSYGVINCLELFEGRELWVGTERKGLIQHDLQMQKTKVYEEINDLSIGRIFDLHKDKEGNLWVLSNAVNIQVANRHFDYLEKEDEQVKNIQALISDYKNQLWIGTQDGLFNLIREADGSTRYERRLPQITSNILSLYEDNYQNLWIGTFGEGVFIYNGESGKIRQLSVEDGLVDGSVLSIDGYEDKIWVGTLAGVTQFTINSRVISEVDMPYNQYDAEDKLDAAFIYKVFVDQNKNIWLGTGSEGINVIRDEQLSYYSGADSISFNSVYSITEDLQGNIWFTTLKEGLFQFDGQTFKRFGIEEGLRNLKITSLITDKQGNILILHTSGIDVLEPETGQIIYFDESIGINNLEPNLNVVCKDQNGDIWVGGQTQILKYLSPKESFRNTPRTILDQVDVSGITTDYMENSSFAYNQNTFLFKYKGLWYTDPETIQYRYQLEGLDGAWIYTRDQEVNYVNLPPGDYTFNVASTANSNFSGEPIQSFEFTIRTPFWERWWFLLLAAAIISAIIWFTLRARERRIVKESRLKREKIESQFEALKSQINPHFLFNSFNTLVAIIEENPNNAVSYVERLSDFYRSILQYRDKAVIPLDEEISVVQNYYYLLKERFGDNLKLSINIREKEAYVPPLAIQMLVENAIKHNIVSAQRPLHIFIEQDEKGSLEVRNTLQPKRIRPKSTAFGLSSIIARFALLSSVKVKIAERNGEFCVLLPLIKSKYRDQIVDPARLEEIEGELEK